MAFLSIRTLRRALLTAAASAVAAGTAHASLAVLVGEPFGSFGTMMPQGHTSIYLDQLCADGPLKLRECRAGEARGVVVARYYRIGQTDWVVTPILEFLYASESVSAVPAYVTPELAWELRERYRRRYLAGLVPDHTERDQATDEWWETVGIAFNRRLWGYQVETTAEQDRALMHMLNDGPNRHIYHLRNANCANFAADIVNLYFPGTVRGPDRVSDMGLMTPKHVARSMYELGQRRPDLHPRVIEIPQIPGTLRRSRPVLGAWESLIKIKRYLFALCVIQPEIPAVGSILYLIHGRWSMDQHAEVVGPIAFAGREQEEPGALETPLQTTASLR